MDKFGSSDDDCSSDEDDGPHGGNSSDDESGHTGIKNPFSPDAPPPPLPLNVRRMKRREEMERVLREREQGNVRVNP